MLETLAWQTLPLSPLLQHVLDTVQEIIAAAVDVCIEKRSFNGLVEQLASIREVLVNLRDLNLGEVPAVSDALKLLYKAIRKAGDLIEKVKNYSPFLNIIYCRHTVKELQSAVSEISNAFEAMRLASPEVVVDLEAGIEMVTDQLHRVNFTADQNHVAIMEEVDRGFSEGRRDGQFANDILKSICSIVGGSQESPQISRELARLRKDKEEAAKTKAFQLDYFLEQVISLLSRADAAYSLEESRLTYDTLKAKYSKVALGPPFDSFNCPISNRIMRCPVTASNKKTYERKAIEEWFENNGFTDPDTHDPLPNGDLRLNRSLLNTIDEWTQQRNVARILHAKSKLQSGKEAELNEACRDLSDLCEESSVYKDWIAFEDLIPSMIKLLQSPIPVELRERILYCLHKLVQNNEANKLHVVEADGIHFVCKCLARKRSLAKAALMVIAEMVNNNLARERMESEKSFILWVVTRRHNHENDDELIRDADYVLDQLSDKDNNIMEMLKWNWWDPFVNKLWQGAEDVKLNMASALPRMELSEDIKRELAKSNVIRALVIMLQSEDTRAKVASLEALQVLSSSSEIRHSMAEAGTVPMVLDVLSKGTPTVRLLETALAIMASLVCNHGTTYLVDSQGLPLQKEAIVKLTGALNISSPAGVTQHVLKCLSELAQGSTSRNTRDLIRERLQVKVVELCLKHGGPEIRELTTLLLSYLSADDGDNKFAIFLSKQRTLELLADQMKHCSAGSISQIAAAGIIANLASHDRNMTVPKPVLQALLGMLACNEATAVESALNALQKLTDLPDVNIKLCLAGLDIFSYLKQNLTSTTSSTKIKAAATILGNLSSSTASLVAHSPVKDQTWPGSPLCKVHSGRCEAKTTLCIIKANLVPQLVALLSHQESQVAEAGIDALYTLFNNGCQSRNAAQVLCNAQIKKPLSHLLTSNSLSCSENAQLLLKQIEIAPPKNPFRYLHLASPK